MKQQISMKLLRQADAAAEERIAEEFPFPMPKNALFERAYRNYLGSAASVAAPPRSGRIRLYRGALLAACLLLTTGLSLGVWSKQQKLASRPPQTAPIASTETTAEETTTETAPPPTSAPAAVTEVSASTAVTASSETAAQTTLPPETALLTETDAPETAPVTDAPTEAVPVPEETEPAPPVQTEPLPTEAAPDLPAVLPTEVTAASAEPSTEAAPEPAQEQLTGFLVMQYPGCRQVICTDTFPEPTGELTPYTVEGEAFTLLSETEEESTEPVRSYEIAGAEKVYTVTQREYAEFILDVEEGELIDISLRRAHGFFLLQDETCALYWFMDGEGFCVSGDAADLRELMEIARSFTPAES